MEVIDPGHEYLLDSYDGGEPVRVVFMKREGEGYPFNVGHHPGTNLQETWRMDIHRLQYVQTQKHCEENLIVIRKLRECIWQLEIRAAKRHGRTLPDLPTDIENVPTCEGCGHIGCEGNHKAHGVSEETFPCPGCPGIFTTRAEVEKHLKEAQHPLTGFEAWWERRKYYHP